MRTIFVLVGVTILAGCGDSGSGRGPFSLDEPDLAAAEAYFGPIDAEEAAFDALQASGDTSAEAVRSFVETVYSPDIVFHDATFGDHMEGHAEVASMYQTFLYYFADAGGEDRPTLVGDPTALQVIPFWDMTLGSNVFTESDPLIEVDLVEIDGDRIGSLRLFYDVASLQKIYGTRTEVDDALQQEYAEAWSSGSIADVTALYAEGADRHDGLADLDVTGIQAIGDEAERWFAAMPEAEWTVQLPFADRAGEQVGAVFDVAHEGCSVTVGILFDVDASGLITMERIHYDPSTLRACGWVD